MARKDAGRVAILVHLGSVHTGAELGILLEQAKVMVIGGRVALDFDLSLDILFSTGCEAEVVEDVDGGGLGVLPS